MPKEKDRQEPIPNMLFTVPEAAVILKVNQNKVGELINHGLLKALKLGRLKIRYQEIESFIARYEGYDLSDLDVIKPLSTAEQLSETG